MPSLLIAFVAGLLTILAPCTLPVIPLVIGGATPGGRRRLAGIAIGFGAAFLASAVVLASVLAAAGVTTSPLRTAAAIGLGIFGAALLFPALGRWLEVRLRPATALGARLPGGGEGLHGGLVTGVAIGLLWAPCVGPLMAAALVVAVAQGPTAGALGVALAYVTGALVPLVAIARWGRHAMRRAGSPERRAKAERAFGGAMVVVCVLTLTGFDTQLQAGIASLLPTDRANAVEAALTGSEPVVEAPGTEAAEPVDLEDLGPAPELTGITTWINSEPLTLASLRGKVVLVHFWTYACSNCKRAQPYVKAWWDRYAPDGLVIVGVHTPELSFEREIDNVREAVSQADVRFPVAFDLDWATWRAYQNHWWPSFYFIDKRGHIRHMQIGEGDYDGDARRIETLLAEPG